MNKPFFAALAVIVALAVALGVFVFLYQQAISPQPVNRTSLLYNGELVTVANYSGAYLSIQFRGSMTLFDCKAAVTYQAINGTQVVLEKDLGLVDTSDNGEYQSFQLTDYPTNNESVHLYFTQDNPPSTVQIVAYGYDSPNSGGK